MRKVYIVNKGAHDFSDAERFGELVELSSGPIDPFGVNNMYRTFVEKLKNSDQDDFIMLSGLPVMQAVACAMFAARHQKLNLLLFKDGKYIERTLVL